MQQRRAWMNRRWHPCPSCCQLDWHLAWCPNGPGPAGRKPAGLGFGRAALDGFEAAKEAMVLATRTPDDGPHLQPSV